MKQQRITTDEVKAGLQALAAHYHKPLRVTRNNWLVTEATEENSDGACLACGLTGALVMSVGVHTTYTLTTGADGTLDAIARALTVSRAYVSGFMDGFDNLCNIRRTTWETARQGEDYAEGFSDGVMIALDLKVGTPDVWGVL